MENTATLPRLNEAAPASRAITAHCERSQDDYKGKWLTLFSHPADSTQVCTPSSSHSSRPPTRRGLDAGLRRHRPASEEPAAIETRKGEGYAMEDWYFATRSL
jgi:hypothetical protein